MPKFERQVGRFVYATNSPFTIVENAEFVTMMEMARPGIKLPGRRAVGGRILEDVHGEEWAKFKRSVPRFGRGVGGGLCLIKVEWAGKVVWGACSKPILNEQNFPTDPFDEWEKRDARHRWMVKPHQSPCVGNFPGYPFRAIIFPVVFCQCPRFFVFDIVLFRWPGA